jgi:hypothetical protein
MRFLAHADTLAGADLASYEVAETAQIRALIDEGVVEQCYVTAEHSGAYIVLNAGDAGAAMALMSSLPMAQAGLLRFTFVELAE